MASEASKPRFVKCPKCLRLLMEIADVPVYKCGVCGTILQAKARHADLQQNPPRSTSDEHSSRGGESNDLSEEGDPPSCRANADMEAGSAPEIPYPGEHSAAMGVDTISVVSGTRSKHGSVTESVISEEEEVLDGIPGSSQIGNAVPSIAGSSRSYELGVSSGDDISGRHERYRRLSRRTFRYRNPSESSGGEAAKDQTEVDSAGKNQTAPPNEIRRDASKIGISGLKQRSSSRDSARTSETDDRSRSASFFSLQNEMESDRLSSASRSPSRDSTSAEDFPCDILSGISSSRLGNLQRDREAEPDPLMDQPAKSYPGGRRDDRRVPVGGSRHDGHRQPVFSNPRSGRKPISQSYQSHGIPFRAEGTGSRLHHHPEGWSDLSHCRSCNPQTYLHDLHPSTAASSGFSNRDHDVFLCDGGDHHRGKLPGTEKPQHKKRRHCRPVSGGAPFVVCDKCSELLQIPVDFLISRGSFHKLRCGSCSEVLTFLYQGGHVLPHHASSSNHEISAPPSPQDALHDQDPVSYSEENGPPPSQSYSTDGEPCATLRSSPEEKGKGRGGPPLHNLLGYVSARDLIFVPGEEDMYQSMDTLSSRFRRADQGDVHGQGCGGTGRSSPAVGCSPNHSEIEEEEEPAVGLPAGSRGRPSVLGFVVRGDHAAEDQLRRGVGSMEIRSNGNRRSR